MFEMQESMVQTAPIILTDGAVSQLNAIKVQQSLSDALGLRVGVKGGGCSGFSYVLGFDEKQADDDEFVVNNTKVYMKKAHALYLMGIEIDFVSGLNNRGFTFSNPNAKDTCGCGTSFSA
jgi:iron-sulfur cluster assembly protein